MSILTVSIVYNYVTKLFKIIISFIIFSRRYELTSNIVIVS